MPSRSANPATSEAPRVIFFGGHPDDCEDKAAGTAALLARAGHAVKFVSVTNGDKGHHELGGAPLVRRRHAESEEAARRLGIAACETLDYHDGELMPTLDVRKDVIRLIRTWNADVVVSHRPNDYHPDHRYVGQVVQDAAYVAQVPNMLPSVPPTQGNPVFLYFQDRFQKPYPFEHEIAIAIDATYEMKIDALDAHVSQFYEFLPWIDGLADEVPDDTAARRTWLRDWWLDRPMSEAQRAALARWYGPEQAAQVAHAESFQIAEYGHQPSEAEIRRLFPMLPESATQRA